MWSFPSTLRSSRKEFIEYIELNRRNGRDCDKQEDLDAFALEYHIQILQRSVDFAEYVQLNQRNGRDCDSQEHVDALAEEYRVQLWQQLERHLQRTQ